MTFPINFRAFLIIALAVVASVFCTYAYMFNRVLGLTLGCVFIVALAVLLGFFIFEYKCGKAKLRVVFAFAIAIALCISAFAVGVVSYDRRNDANVDGYRSVYGRVAAVDVRSGVYKFNLDELMIDGKETDGIMRVTFSPSDNNISEFISCGDRLAFGAQVKSVKMFSHGYVDGTSYRTDIRYNVFIDGENVSVVQGEPRVLETFLQSLRSLYVKNMGERFGNIAFSMLTGDKYGLDGNVSDYYSASGLGHIMAVSGLHIGFFVVLLSFLLCKINRKVRLPIIGAVLIGYAVIADFSPSVMRAVIMAFIAGISFVVGGRRDILSSLFCALSLILAVKPFYLFDVSFLLSFGALFGIAMFANSIKLFLTARGVHNKIANATGAALSVSIGLFPAQIYFFGKVQIFAIAVNMIVLPYISVIFVMLVCLTPIAALPSCGILLKICEYLMLPLDYIAYGIASLPFAQFGITAGGAVFLCYPIMFCAGGYLMSERKKTAIILYSAVACIAIICVSAL